MGLWSQRWLRHDLAETENLDSDLLMRDIRRNVSGHAPVRVGRYIVEFRLSGVPISRRCYWLVFDGGNVDLCYRDPGFEVDLFLEAKLRVLTRIWLRHIPVGDAIRDGRLHLDGRRSDIKAFRSWFALSMFAEAGLEQARQAQAAH